MALTPAGLEPIKPQILHPRLALLSFIRCQTPLKLLIYRSFFGNYERVTKSPLNQSGCDYIIEVSVEPVQKEL